MGADPAISSAATTTVARLFAARAQVMPERLAIVDGATRRSYRELDHRTQRLANALLARGVKRGERIALLSENRGEVLEVMLAAARIGAVVACQNWRLAAPELRHCIALVEPALAIVSPRHRGRISDVATLELADDYERELAAADPVHIAADLDPEDALLILYTSGTTGLPKGAVLSHRAQIVRNLVTRAEFAVAPDDTFVAWSPLYHMGAVDNSLGTLMSGGTVFVVDGFDAARLAEIVATEPLGWLLLMPGMVGRFADELALQRVTPRGVKVCGVMADLVPPSEIAAITTALRAPYANTFGATETGCPPCSSSLIPIGTTPTKLSKQQSPFCEVRLVGPDDRDVADGEPGELAMRGPTLFSGYWRTPADDFRGGWFHMGDVFMRNSDGSLDFVDRVKYLIKSGGENIYPAEIERVILTEPRVADVAVVRALDAKWGEVPIAFVARRDPSLDDTALFALCRAELAGYKQPKAIRFIAESELPRSASGKILRHELERRVRGEP